MQCRRGRFSRPPLPALFLMPELPPLQPSPIPIPLFPLPFPCSRSRPRVLASHGFPNLLSTVHLTACRPDLNLDGTHYAKAVSIAMMDLWLTAATATPA